MNRDTWRFVGRADEARAHIVGVEFMSEKDLSEKNLFGLNDVFADFLNAFYRPKDAPRI